MPPRGSRTAVILLTSVLALTACTAGPDPAPVPDASLPYLQEAIDRVPDRVAELLEETGVPRLSVGIVHGDEIVYADGFGVANLDTGAAVDSDTLFQLASVSKPVGATVIGALIGRGDLEWTDRVIDHTPGFALSDPWVTEHLQVADLYSHRSGVADHSGDDLASFGVDGATILERFRHLPLGPFRDQYAYSNFGIQAGALAAAASAGGDWMELSDEVLYTPLGMTRTTSSFAEYTAAENHSVGHSPLDGQWRVTPEQLDDDLATAAGGVASSAADMSLWLRMLLAGGEFAGQRVVDEEALAQAMSAQNLIPQHPANPELVSTSYGYGFQVGVLSGTGYTFISHSGAFSQGAGTMVAVVPALDLGVVVLTNGYPIGLAESVTMEIIDWARTGGLTQDWWQLYGDAFAGITGDYASSVAEDAPADAAAPGPLEAYAGSYRSDYFGDATVALVEGALELTIRPTADTGQTWVLEPYDGEVFRVLLDNVDASPTSVSAVTFAPGASAFTFEFFDSSSGGAGTFARVG